MTAKPTARDRAQVAAMQGEQIGAAVKKVREGMMAHDPIDTEAYAVLQGVMQAKGYTPEHIEQCWSWLRERAGRGDAKACSTLEGFRAKVRRAKAKIKQEGIHE